MIEAEKVIEREGSYMPPEDAVAMFLLDRSCKERMSEHNQMVLEMYVSWYLDNPQFHGLVEERKLKMDGGVRTKLFEDPDLDKARHHRKARHKGNKRAFQPELWEREGKGSKLFTSESNTDPEEEITRMHKEAGKLHLGKIGEIERMRTRENTRELRKIIGLPTLKRGSADRKDKFRKKLVRDYVVFDVSGIFHDYDSLVTTKEIPAELQEKINKVSSQVKELLGPGLTRLEKFRRLGKYEEEYGATEGIFKREREPEVQ